MHNFGILRVHTVPSQDLLSPSTAMRLMALKTVVTSYGQTDHDLEVITNARTGQSTCLKTNDSGLPTGRQGWH